MSAGRSPALSSADVPLHGLQLIEANAGTAKPGPLLRSICAALRDEAPGRIDLGRDLYRGRHCGVARTRSPASAARRALMDGQTGDVAPGRS
jgi:hypothetical protein